MKDYGTIDNLGFARVDLARQRRQGVPEVVYGAGKTAGQIAAILASLRDHGQTPALATRMDEDKAKAVADALGDRIQTESLGATIKLKGKAEGFEVLRLL